MSWPSWFDTPLRLLCIKKMDELKLTMVADLLDPMLDILPKEEIERYCNIQLNFLEFPTGLRKFIQNASKILKYGALQTITTKLNLFPAERVPGYLSKNRKLCIIHIE